MVGAPTPAAPARPEGPFLTWQRAVLLAVALLLFLGGRGAEVLLVVLGLTLWVSAQSVGAAARGLEVALAVRDHHVFAGATARVEVVVRSRSPWPVALLALEVRVPDGLAGRFRRILTLGPRAERRFAFTLRGHRRGVYRVGDLRVVLSDWFGLREETTAARVPARLVVYPPLLGLPDLPSVRRLPVGPRRDPRSPFREEPPVGVRPYVPGDALRSIAWKASAHRGALVVRELPPVREAATWVFLDLRAADWDRLYRAHLTEDAVAVAGSLVRGAHRAGRPVGLAAWGALVEHDVYGAVPLAEGAWVRLPPRGDPGHPLRVLEVLAALRHAPGPEFAPHLRAEAARLPWGSEVWVLVPRDTPELWQVTAGLAGRGHPVTMLVFERVMDRPPGLGGRTLPRVREAFVREVVTFR
jgi:uncharacterized protein (DUF58 family)